MTVLSATHVTKKYGSHTAVDDVSFSLPEGKCIALIGPNGAGKTTILRMLSGLLSPTNGDVRLDNIVNHVDYRKFIGYLPQYPVFYNWMTGREFLIYSGQLSLLSKVEATKAADEMLKKVGIEEAKNKRISGYSGGMKQRLGLAQALIHQPKVLILDEPVSSLDPLGRRDVLTLMKELKESMTILFSTHILSDADAISDEMLLLHKGKLIESGTMQELREKYQTDVIELEFQGIQDLQQYEKRIRNIPFVTEVKVNQTSIAVIADDLSLLRKTLLEKAGQENWPLIGFSLNKAEMEDIFMKVVKQ
ncbi:ATP-binding cassette domain-containing protein [Oceanobacillus sp. M65]|uniref:ABC transporter ATP-binding protein n=1 Tax=Oceanobacillus sp. M65 TaxID=3457435 RepID=UPI0013734AE2|nr:ATP-binding cassette domain-containing protein [Halomonas sp. MG34]